MVVGADIDGICVDGAALMELGSWSHLIARFFDFLGADPLTEAEHREVESWLDGAGEEAIYWEQPVADQRHGLEAARRVAATWEGRRDLVRAALLHDVGKRRSNLGVIARSLASLLAKLGIPTRGAWRLYLEHGSQGAEELARLGAEPLVVAFTHHHHHGRPAGFPAEEWEALKSADR